MKNRDLKTMSTDELWKVYEQVVKELTCKIGAEKARLDDRLRRISVPVLTAEAHDRPRRPYPKVLPKYRNPNNPDQTWAGRGKEPRWLRAQLRSGKKLDDLLISGSAAK
ncbi:H-NS histone family protein [Bradyrhizobium sp. Tv2a-2]|uniref:H-NS histone family protein n=1 Tax=Bradyrhizobium sp. Tv2a-2 TaxID=113395 RepID=UPI0004663748|nr:H-NS histone family protein [Bradyrhizobium sp. Tv2a-2]